MKIFTLIPSEIFNIPLNEVSQQERSLAKTINFGIIYGIGPKGYLFKSIVILRPQKNILKNILIVI